jgi:DNA-binding MarR family transcriptional regulator
MESDQVDMFIKQWNRERPDLDPAALGVTSRLLMLYKYLEQSADEALEPFGLTLWQFDVLSALRRSGPPFALSPTQLTEVATLSSGAMTNRIDRLESMGLVQRNPDPHDRRGVLIALTPKGKKLVDQAIVARLQDARDVLAPYSKVEQKKLADMLRRLLVFLGNNARDAGRLRRVQGMAGPPAGTRKAESVR